MNQNPTPNPHSFKVLDTRTGEYVTDIKDFWVFSNGKLIKWNGDKELDFSGKVVRLAKNAPKYLRAVFPHEERALEFALREGEGFVDRCNRLFKEGDGVWYDEFDNGSWRICIVEQSFTPSPSGKTSTAKAWFKGYEGGVLFEPKDLEFNCYCPLPND